MKQETLDVGIRGFSVTVNVRIPESDADVEKLSKGSAPYRIQKFIRGWRIDNQEDSGAREYVASRVAGKDGAMLKDPAFIKDVMEGVQKIVDNFDPTAPSQRGRTRKPVTLAVPKGKKTFTAEEVAKLAAAAGLTVVSE